MAAKTQTVTEVLNAAGVDKTPASLISTYTAFQMGASGTQADIMEAAGTKDTATRMALAVLVTKGLVVKTEGTNTGPVADRTPATYALPVTKKTSKKTATAKKATPAKTVTVAEAAAKSTSGTYGKAMVQILDFMKSHPDELFTVPEVMTELNRPWYNATNQALKALAARETGVTETKNDKNVRAYSYSDK